MTLTAMQRARSHQRFGHSGKTLLRYLHNLVAFATAWFRQDCDRYDDTGGAQ